MNKTFSPEQISRTGNLDANLHLRQHKLDLSNRFLKIESINRKLKQRQVAKELGYPSSTVQRFRIDIKMRSPLTNQTIPKNLQKLQMFPLRTVYKVNMTSKTSKDLKKPITNKRTKLKDGDLSDNSSHGSVPTEQIFSD